MTENLTNWLLARVVADEHGHLIWQHYCGEAGPQGRLYGKTQQVRRVIWSEMHDGRNPGKRWVRPECGIFRCLEPSCLIACERSFVMVGAERGADHAARVAAGRQRTAPKLDAAKARAIRLGEVTPQQAVQLYGIHVSMAYRIRQGGAWQDLSNPLAPALFAR